MGDRGVGVEGLDDLQVAAFDHQPGPAAAELADTGCLELFLELIQAAPSGVDLVGQIAAGLAAAAGLHAFPIKRVVPDLGGVVENAGLVGIAGTVFDNRFQVFLAAAGGIAQKIVQVGDISLMMFAVVEAERVGRNMRLQGILRIR